MFRKDELKILFREAETTPWKCSACKIGFLSASENISSIESQDSLAQHDDPSWEADWTEGRFSCLLKCNHCSDVVSCSGITRFVLEQDYENEEQRWMPEYHPKFFFPAPPLFDFSNKVSKELRKEIERGFFLFWIDPSACGNSVRIAVELLLDNLGVPRRNRVIDKKTRLTKYPVSSLQYRLNVLAKKKKHEEITESLVAIKWLGNVGSHPGDGLRQEDLLDVFEILSHALDEIFEERTAKRRKLVKAINKSRRPQRPRDK